MREFATNLLSSHGFMAHGTATCGGRASCMPYVAPAGRLREEIPIDARERMPMVGTTSLHRCIPEIMLHIGEDIVFLNPLHFIKELHRDDGPPACEDGDRRCRISGHADLYRRQSVHDELMRLGNGRWADGEVAAAIQESDAYLMRELGVLGLIV